MDHPIRLTYHLKVHSISKQLSYMMALLILALILLTTTISAHHHHHSYSTFTYAPTTPVRYATPLSSPLTYTTPFAEPFSKVSTLLDPNITYTTYTLNPTATATASITDDGPYGQSGFYLGCVEQRVADRRRVESRRTRTVCYGWNRVITVHGEQFECRCDVLFPV